ncbi:transcriptional regulator, TetR family [Pseudooceanicola antarcticus]|uniref:TetR/AcrR family transcriptional regulator n=1 Tax=Pseudooceanicola antarcticus TaxID=1247613 RepID=A0A285J384_9RHOB|nr:TetR/AcrR family transcriptional regulator [Pseudooceanicola antarcticus]PJE29698.1 TetR/AcrR family transcriptional regulator [Pseudooceanicola antarcticus]SNY54790.1 transcriptional regulator, TetR family [Pseudooceanicola antarcticus]
MADWNGEIASREELRERKRRAALRVASRLFNEKGYHATSLDEIADRIGVTKTALYYYFRNKEELLYECIELSLKAGERARERAHEGESALDRFKTFYFTFLREVMADGGTYTTRMNVRALPAPMRDTITERLAALSNHIAELLDAAVAEGSMRPLDSKSTAIFLTSAVNWMVAYPQEYLTGQVDNSSEAEAFLEQLVYGLATR